MRFTYLRITVAAYALSYCAFAQKPAEEPKDLTTLRQSWINAKAQAIDPINKKYSEALESMKLRFTKAGDLKSAIAVDKELTAVTASSTSNSKQASESLKPTKLSLEEILVNSKWIAGNTDLIFLGHGKVKSGDRILTYKIISPNEFELWWSGAKGNSCKLNSDLSQFTESGNTVWRAIQINQSNIEAEQEGAGKAPRATP